ncbi:MAG: hypothetical protein MZU91_06995 [Desulfosudis oleivorans]|nr:hypothetical protein [Desulfosudis oleivorans]
MPWARSSGWAGLRPARTSPDHRHQRASAEEKRAAEPAAPDHGRRSLWPWSRSRPSRSLARIGGTASLELLARIGDDQEDPAKEARDAEGKIKSRLAK